MNLKEYYKNRLNELMEQEAPPTGWDVRTVPTRKWDPVERSQARDSATVLDFTAKRPEATLAPLRDSAELIRSRNEIAANKFKTSIGLYPTSSAKEGEEIKTKATTAAADLRKANDKAGLYDVYKNLGRRR